MARCRSCGADVLWVETVNGRKMPVDAAPDPEGQWEIDDDGVAHYATPLLGAEDRFMSHFKTCPHGKEWSNG